MVQTQRPSALRSPPEVERLAGLFHCVAWSRVSAGKVFPWTRSNSHAADRKHDGPPRYQHPCTIAPKDDRYRSNSSSFLVGVFVFAFWKLRPVERGCMTDAFSRESFVFKSSFPSFRFLSLRVPSAGDRAYPLAGCKTDRFAGKAVGLPSRSAHTFLCHCPEIPQDLEKANVR